METILKSDVVVAGLTYTPGTPLRLRFQATGTNPTVLRTRVWRLGAAEPTTWTVSITDATAALQAAGGVGIMGYLSGSRHPTRR